MNNNHKNAVIVSLNEDISEILDLANSLNYSVNKTFFQNRKNPDVNSYVGAGKLAFFHYVIFTTKI